MFTRQGERGACVSVALSLFRVLVVVPLRGCGLTRETALGRLLALACCPMGVPCLWEALGYFGRLV